MLSIPPDECWCKWRPDCNPICQETLIMCSFCVIDVEDWRYFCKFKVSSDIRLHLACSVLHSPTINQYQCLLDIITGVCLQQQHAAGCTPPLCSNCALHITSASSQPAVVWRHVLLTRCATWCDTPRHVVTRGMSGVITVVTRVRILSRVLPTHHLPPVLTVREWFLSNYAVAVAGHCWPTVRAYCCGCAVRF